MNTQVSEARWEQVFLLESLLTRRVHGNTPGEARN
jgi:hypothetical protein